MNDSDENMSQTIFWLEQHLSKAKLELLPYHNLVISKSQAMGLDYTEFHAPSEKRLLEIESLVRSSRIPLISGR